ncbi:MAG: chloride channel protein [Candidatus Koribacter versatilis]|uniref:Chloride channel protein n=1 Tax=Candidatus Korobacter versatilis TaxID=658062 RepID=A0A932AA87_9BACT|nr:chloride channel protein [Candidatus Koribacter versatilis]
MPASAATAGKPAAFTAEFRMLTVSLLAAAIGIVAGVIAFLLYNLIGFFTNLFFFHHMGFVFPSLQTNTLGFWVIVVPVAGGLIVGLMARYGTDKIRGHGIPEAMEAVLVNRSRISPRVAVLKPISAAIAIGTGGPFGAEGPIIQTGGAFGSLVGQVFHTTAAERKVLLACGAAAGMAATFSTPIAAVILAIELLLFEFKARSFIPLVIASTLATSIHIRLMGPGPMFDVGTHDFGVPRALPFYLLLGLLCGVAAVGLSKLLYWVEDLFEKLPVNEMWWPAIGALGLGIIGYFVPRVLGVGYDTISDILTDRLTLSVLVLVLVFKTLALVISLGSGTSGGLLAPTFMSSAAMGSVFAVAMNRIFPAAHLSPAAFALVAMGAVFGAASRATFTFIIFAFEITRDYNAVLPLMLVCVIADGIAIWMQPGASIMTEKLARRGLKIHAEYEPDVMTQVTVGTAMTPDIPTIPATMPLLELAGMMTSGHPLARHYALPIVDGEERLVAIITRGDVVKRLEHEPQSSATVLEAGTPDPVVAYPDEGLHEAVERMLRAEVGRLPVVSREHPKRVVGYLGRAGVMAARMRRLEEEHVREPGWWGKTTA